MFNNSLCTDRIRVETVLHWKPGKLSPHPQICNLWPTVQNLTASVIWRIREMCEWFPEVVMLIYVWVLSHFSSIRLCYPMDFSWLLGFSVHETLQARILDGVGCRALLQGNLPDPGIELISSALQADSLPTEPLRKSPLLSAALLFVFCLEFSTSLLPYLLPIDLAMAQVNEIFPDQTCVTLVVPRTSTAPCLFLSYFL